MKLALKDRLTRLTELEQAELNGFSAELADRLAELPTDSAESVGEAAALAAAGDAIRHEFIRREREWDQSALAASGADHSNAVRRMAARQQPVKPSPEVRTANRTALAASGNLYGVGRGEPIEDRWQLAQEMAEMLERMDRRGPALGRVLVASAEFDYPEDRRLTGEPSHDARLLDAVTSPQALVATGGVCAPTNVDYSVPTFASADRPLRDGLPSFQATRGGLLFVQPPDIASLAGATSIWTEATDAAPGAATKPLLQVTCGSTVQVYVDAVPTRLGFGNMQGRFAPEQVAANTDLAMAAAARIAENNILNKLAAFATQNVTSSILLGATRDLLTALHQAVASYRNAHRIPSTQAITAVLPEWVRGLIRADLAREIGHAQTADWNSLALTDDQVDELLSAAGVRPIWHYDGQSSSVSGGVAQTFSVQSASGAIESFPTKMVSYLFAEGSVQFLDGGRLDLGVVRDSTLDATNDFEVLVETFEGVANRGFSGSVVQIVSSLCANGASAGTTSTASACA